MSWPLPGAMTENAGMRRALPAAQPTECGTTTRAPRRGRIQPLAARLLLAAAMLAFGNACVFVARDVRTEVVVALSQAAADEEVVVESVGEERLTLTVIGRTIEVATSRARTCKRVTYATYEVRITKQLGTAWSPGFLDAMGDLLETRILTPLALVGLAGAGVIGVISLPLATGEVLISNHWPVRARERRSAATASGPCPLPIAAHVRIEVPSGATLSVDTDDTGRARFELAATEPANGVVHAALGRQRIDLSYFVDRATCAATRDAQLASIAAASREQRRAMVVGLPPCGKLTTGGPSDAPREAAWELTRAAILDALDGRCMAVLIASGTVGDLDRAHRDTSFATEPDIAACLASGLVPEQIASGVEAMRQRLLRCAPLLPGGGTIHLELSVSGAGKVTSTVVTGGESELAECVQLVMARAAFPPTPLGGRATVPFELPDWQP